MVCACALSSRFSHLLTLTTVAFILPPATILLFTGNHLLGAISCALSVASFMYHVEHTARRRALDVSLIHVTGTIGIAQLALEVHRNGWNRAMTAAVASLLAVVVINFSPMFRQKERPHVLSLQWHVGLHAATAAALASMALAIS